MQYQEALDYISEAAVPGSIPGLSRTEALLANLGSPQDRLKYIHVAGTNGKGSVCSYLQSVLTAAGYKTALYTSPHLSRINERYKIDGKDISDTRFAEIIEKTAKANDACGRQCTEFEILTAAAFLYFAEEGAEVCVLETGLGGRLDATNVIKAYDCAVITNIGLDHTEILGSSLAEVAGEKAGILKGGLAVSYEAEPEVKNALCDAALKTGTSLVFADFDELNSLVASPGSQSFIYKGEKYEISLQGEHQIKNAALAIEAVAQLRHAGYKISEAALKGGVLAAKNPARFEILSSDPVFILDGGHNTQCAVAAAKAAEDYFPKLKKTVIVGIMADKDVSGVIDALGKIADSFVAVMPQNGRAMPAENLRDFIISRGHRATAAKSIPEAVNIATVTALNNDGIVLCIGSLYMAGEVREYFGL
ncbi:MAG: bifunctional folylpolyglutamate synthase/dihydrofolate synthase [Ruminococcaceae bacterium]|nr:bifunctional folylpolyglutamate synthase/dihydrofolate synthase [Oscillospiraceae bacterium]